jgi:hypothetical protein
MGCSRTGGGRGPLTGGASSAATEHLGSHIPFRREDEAVATA